MTKEELEKEAVEYADSIEEKKHWSDENDSNAVFTREEVEQAYTTGAEPREKRIKHLEESLLDVTEKSVKRITELEKEIKSLGERCLQLQKDKGNLTDRVRELEVQIEKMKCCANCKYTPPFDKHCDNCIQGAIKLKYKNWKLGR